jgi:hypothetical protein
MIRSLIKWWQSLRYYVIADPADNSVTLSKRLFKHIKNNAKNNASTSVFVFAIPEHGTYGFMHGHGIEQPTQLCNIQYNDKYKCIGFESLCPSVCLILYDYGLPANLRVKLSVSIKKTTLREIYYQLNKPNEKYIRQ